MQQVSNCSSLHPSLHSPLTNHTFFTNHTFLPTTLFSFSAKILAFICTNVFYQLHFFRPTKILAFICTNVFYQPHFFLPTKILAFICTIIFYQPHYFLPTKILTLKGFKSMISQLGLDTETQYPNSQAIYTQRHKSKQIALVNLIISC